MRPIANEGALDHRTALLQNCKLTVGAFALTDSGMLVFVTASPYATSTLRNSTCRFESWPSTLTRSRGSSQPAETSSSVRVRAEQADEEPSAASGGGRCSLVDLVRHASVATTQVYLSRVGAHEAVEAMRNRERREP